MSDELSYKVYYDKESSKVYDFIFLKINSKSSVCIRLFTGGILRRAVFKLNFSNEKGYVNYVVSLERN